MLFHPGHAFWAASIPRTNPKGLQWHGICARLTARPSKQCVMGPPMMVIYWLVVWNIWIIFPNIWDNPSHWLIFFRGVETTNQFNIGCVNHHGNLKRDDDDWPMDSRFSDPSCIKLPRFWRRTGVLHDGGRVVEGGGGPCWIFTKTLAELVAVVSQPRMICIYYNLLYIYIYLYNTSSLTV